jgi:hypothetical protein
VLREGYAPEEQRVSITAARPSQSLTFELEPTRAAADRSSRPAPVAPASANQFVGALVVDSRPAGASVFLDGKPVGTTPLSLNSVNAGSHAIRIERDGYRRWTSAVRVVAGEQNRVTASLER